MYHILFKKDEFIPTKMSILTDDDVFFKKNESIPTGITIVADNAISALTHFSITHPGVQFIGMYKITQAGELEW